MTGQRIDAHFVAAGKYHDIDFARLEMLKLLAEHPNVRTTVANDYADTARLNDCAFLVSYTCDLMPSEAETVAIRDWIERGGRWLALHGTNSILEFTADGVATPERRPDVMALLGTQFKAHPPIGPFHVEVIERDHALTSGIDDFEVIDELYLSKTLSPIRVLMQTRFTGEATGFVDADWHDAIVPILYLRDVGAGQILYNTLGHCRGHYDLGAIQPFYDHPERCAWNYPVYYDLLRRGLRWAMGGWTMDMALSPADTAFQMEVRAFLAANLPAHIRDGAARTPGVFVEPDIGVEWQRILHAKGWLAVHWPIEDGGTGWTPMQRYLFDKECALAGAPSLSVLGLKLVGPVICRFGTPEQKTHFLPRILSGEDSWCQGYSEPGSGSDLASLKTRAVRDGNAYRVNGSKIWTTHAHYANWIFALVRTDAGARPQSGISFLLVPMDQPGISVTPIITLAGDHEVNAVFFDDAVTAIDNRVGEEGQGWTIAKFLLENERGGSCHAPRLLVALDRLALQAAEIGSGINGAMTHDRDFRLRLARLRLEAQALEVTELRILADIADGRPPGSQTSLTKLIASGLMRKIDTLAMDLHGYEGLQLPAERPLYGNKAPEPIGHRDAQITAAAYLNSRAWTIFGGTDEVQKNIIAKTVLGL